jgi:hypothetical protein
MFACSTYTIFQFTSLLAEAKIQGHVELAPTPLLPPSRCSKVPSAPFIEQIFISNRPKLTEKISLSRNTTMNAIA